MTDSHTFYTHDIPIRRGLVSGSLQVFSWLLVHPQAWQRAVLRLAPDLAPDFCLAQLSGAHFKRPELRHLLVQMMVVPPVLISILVAVLTSFLGWPIIHVVRATWISALYAVFTLLTVGTFGSLGVGMVYAVTIGLGIGLINPSSAREISFPLGISAGLAGSCLLQIFPRRNTPSPMRWISAMFVSLVSLAATVGLLYLFVSGILPEYLLTITPYNEEVGTNHIIGTIAIFIMIALASLACLSLRLGKSGRRWWLILISGGLAAPSFWGVLHHFPGDSELFYLPAGIVGGIFFGLMFTLFGLVAERLGGRHVAAVAAALAAGLGWVHIAPFTIRAYEFDSVRLALGCFFLLLGLSQSNWLPVLLYPFLSVWNYFTYLQDHSTSAGEKPQFRNHPAFWLENQVIPWLGLEDHLLLVMVRWPEEGRRALDFLQRSPFRRSARSAVMEMEARRLENCVEIHQIAQQGERITVLDAAQVEGSLLRQFEKIGYEVSAALCRANPAHVHQAMVDVSTHLRQIQEDLLVSAEPTSRRFLTVANRWNSIITGYLQELEVAVDGENELENPYICGVPLNDQQKVFVGRVDLMRQIELALLDQHTAPILLYGQRRMGKTSLMLNLGRILPGRLLPLFIDCQSLAAINPFPSMVYSVTQQMKRSAFRQRGVKMPDIPIEKLESPEQILAIYHWLDETEQFMTHHRLTAVILFDEFEVLDQIVSRMGPAADPFLSLFRHVIQHHPTFRYILAGSHSPDEFTRWTPYLINLHVMKIGCLDQTEARQLIERPVANYRLHYQPEAVDRILALTGCHPNLVQLICFELVELKNEQPLPERLLATVEEVNLAGRKTLETGKFFFVDIENNQISPEGATLLRVLARLGPGAVIDAATWLEHAPTASEECIEYLMRRELIEPAAGGYRFQIELVRRWFARDFV